MRDVPGSDLLHAQYAFGVEADSDSLKPVQELLALLPSVAKIIGKFDFLEAKLSVTQRADEPGSYTRRSVTMVRPKAGE